MPSENEPNALITEDWLRDCGFKWEQHKRQDTKHWLLWIGAACLDYDRTAMHDSLGIELSAINQSDPAFETYWGLWHCWIRNDIAGRYARIIHVRYLRLQSEVESLISALTGISVNWKDSMYGSLHNPQVAERMRKERMRLDQRINHAWVERVDADKGIIGINKDKKGVTLP